ncbi:hypothetical protein BURMUCGD2M_5759 [Burkholderia multivorans CGD2M]|uniref:Uncharacterized protein n=1 Tax=Burkholderia multivorans CGD2 TaxID=513052 RepID=B9BL11_9BURK|nr:hypothetical protein BURMUCGD2_5769 [Burkholderia multivorans CGD2]EEE16314.1 hypothetical protein BURMUCGD2M_5759 [Burkholderia multivorans CGD2M]PRF25185.1 hypothetical protein C6Q03_09175 [Burkholderia multivorans]PRH16374.1 hypothetical protein C6T53_27210 [Burkholderia multivorans]
MAMLFRICHKNAARFAYRHARQNTRINTTLWTAANLYITHKFHPIHRHTKLSRFNQQKQMPFKLPLRI